MLSDNDIRHTLSLVEFPGLEIKFLKAATADTIYLQVSCPEGTDNVTGLPNGWAGRKWLLSRHMTRSELVSTAFKAVLTAIEHEARELFKYCGQTIYDPHIDVDKLATLRAEEGLASLSTREDHDSTAK